MWYKIEEIEEKYGLTKFSIYALITQEPELRKYIKAMEGVLQINEQGIGVLLKHASKKAQNQDGATYADNNTIIMKPERKEAAAAAPMQESVPAPAPAPAPQPEAKSSSADEDFFAGAFNTEGSFFDEDIVVESASPKEDFFSSMELDYKEPADRDEDAGFAAAMAAAVPAAVPAAAPVEESSFVDELIFADEPAPVVELEEEDEVNPAVYDDVPQDDFFTDDVDDAGFLDKEPEVVTEFAAPTEEEFTMEGYLKALKTKLVIQNEQIRALDAYLDVSRKLLIQDEKIVNILEGMSRK